MGFEKRAMGMLLESHAVHPTMPSAVDGILDFAHDR